MALASPTALNQALDALSGGATNLLGFIALHTGSPGTTGLLEYAGVTRQACTWNAAAAGSKTNSSALTFTTSGATPVTHLAGWSLVSAGVYGIGAALTSNVTAATITVAAGAITFSAT